MAVDTCPSCGGALEGGFGRCPHCGHFEADMAHPDSPEAKAAAAAGFVTMTLNEGEAAEISARREWAVQNPEEFDAKGFYVGFASDTPSFDGASFAADLPEDEPTASEASESPENGPTAASTAPEAPAQADTTEAAPPAGDAAPNAETALVTEAATVTEVPDAPLTQPEANPPAAE